MNSYYRVMLGKRSAYAEQCFAGNFIGTDFDIGQDLTGALPEDGREFNKEFIPEFLARHPEKTKTGAGLACGFLWRVSKGIKIRYVVVCPDGTGRYRVGAVTGEYFYKPGETLPHRRPVSWTQSSIERAWMSEALRNSTGSTGTVSNITPYRDEIERLIGGISVPIPVGADETAEDPSAFVMEKHLEDFLVLNWAQTELAKEYDIYEEDGERVGQQYPADN